MPATLGEVTKTTFFKGIENHKLHEEFDAAGLFHTLTFDAALVASNSTAGNVGGNAITPVVFATDSDTTMAAIATEIATQPGVKSAAVTEVGGGASNDRVIVVVPTDQVAGVPLTGFLVTGGAGQAVITVATVDEKVKAGMPVELDAVSGKVKPVTAATHDLTCIGYAIHDAVEGELVTIALRGIAIIFARTAEAMPFGPVKFDSYDAINKFNKVTDDTVTVANRMGWALDDAAAADEAVRVIII